MITKMHGITTSRDGYARQFEFAFRSLHLLHCITIDVEIIMIKFAIWTASFSELEPSLPLLLHLKECVKGCADGTPLHTLKSFCL
jgi:hypothetical protein